MNSKSSDIPGILNDAMVLAAILAVLAALAYAGSINGPFLKGDISNILENPGVSSLISPCGEGGCPEGRALFGRPLARISFALNYLAGQNSPTGYHAVNIAIHVMAALALFALVRLTLEKSAPLSARYARYAAPLAFFSALLWSVHPVNTQAVAYVSGRLESLPGLFFLLCLYGAARASFDEKPLFGNILAAASFLMGLGAGNVLLAAPFAVAAYQHLFSPKKFSESVARSAVFYIACSTGAAVWVLSHVFSVRPEEAGVFRTPGVIEYAREEPRIIARYLSLALFPRGLVFDYWWTPSDGYGFIPFLAGIGAALAAVVYGLVRRRAWAFAGVCVFAPLAVSSSFFPSLDFASEDRMYLPLAALCALVVMAAARICAKRGGGAFMVFVMACAVFAMVLFGSTFARSSHYADARQIWEDTSRKRPENPRAHDGVGAALLEKGDYDGAVKRFKAALDIENRYAPAHFNTGNAFFAQDRAREAIRHYRRAVLVDPGYWQAYANLGAALCAAGSWDEGVWSLEQAAGIHPFNPELAANLDRARTERKKMLDAERERFK